MNCLCTICFYCDQPLSSRHEHDHFPMPKELGGTKTRPVCINCHDLKDRMALDSLSWFALAGRMQSEWGNMPPATRIFVARMARDTLYAIGLEGVEVSKSPAPEPRSSVAEECSTEAKTAH